MRRDGAEGEEMKQPTISAQIAAVHIARDILTGAKSKSTRASEVDKLRVDIDAAINTLLEVDQQLARQRFVDGDGAPR